MCPNFSHVYFRWSPGLGWFVKTNTFPVHYPLFAFSKSGSQCYLGKIGGDDFDVSIGLVIK